MKLAILVKIFRPGDRADSGGFDICRGLDFSRLRASSLSQTFLFQSRAKTWKTPTLTLDESCPHHTSTPT
jgi:hypothetical protein